MCGEMMALVRGKDVRKIGDVNQLEYQEYKLGVVTNLKKKHKKGVPSAPEPLNSLFIVQI